MVIKPVWIVVGSLAGTTLVAGATVAGMHYFQTSASETVSMSLLTDAGRATLSASGTVSSTSEIGTPAAVAMQTDQLAGEYWCRSYNVDGAGGSCATQRRLSLNPDGSYDFGTTGHWLVNGTTVTFDGDLASRGPATLTADRELRWEFTRDDKPYTITYYWRQVSTSTASPTSTAVATSATPSSTTSATTSPSATATKTPKADVTTIQPISFTPVTNSASPTASSSSSPTPTQTSPAPNIAGSYTCVSSGSGPCDTSQTIEVFSDGTWYEGSNVGTYRVSGSTVYFDSPYAGGGAGWASAGPADWGPADLAGNSLTFYNEGVPVRYQR